VRKGKRYHQALGLRNITEFSTMVQMILRHFNARCDKRTGCEGVVGISVSFSFIRAFAQRRYARTMAFWNVCMARKVPDYGQLTNFMLTKVE
jgi:hypothetical protein